MALTENNIVLTYTFINYIIDNFSLFYTKYFLNGFLEAETTHRYFLNLFVFSQ